MCFSRKPLRDMSCSVKQSLSRTPVPASPDSPVYFNRADVKAAIHAPADVDWTLCAGFVGVNVFPQDDSSFPSSLTVLPNVIEKSNRSVIAHGLADFVYIAEGARIVLQKCVFTLSVSMSQY